MLMLVGDTDTPATLAARRREAADEVARIAAAPVRFVPAAFLAAVEGLFPDAAEAAPRRTLAR